MRVIVEGTVRARAESLQVDKGMLLGGIKAMPEPSERSVEIDAHVRRLQELVDRALSLATGLSPDIKALVGALDDPLRIAYLMASLLDIKPEEKQQLLEEESLARKLDTVSTALAREIEVLELKGKIESRAEQEMTDAQRQYLLRQQMKAIQTELGEGADSEAQELRKRVTDANLPEAIAAGGAPRGRSARAHDPGIARVPDDPHLHRLGAGRALGEDDGGSARPRRRAPDARRRSLRPRQGQRADRRVPRGAEAEGRSERADPVLRRPARRRQDVARTVDRARDEPQVRAPLARRRARRSRDSRAPPHLHRLDARPHRAGVEVGWKREPGADARRDRQDVRRHPG